MSCHVRLPSGARLEVPPPDDLVPFVSPLPDSSGTGRPLTLSASRSPYTRSRRYTSVRRQIPRCEAVRLPGSC